MVEHHVHDCLRQNNTRFVEHHISLLLPRYVGRDLLGHHFMECRSFTILESMMKSCGTIRITPCLKSWAFSLTGIYVSSSAKNSTTYS
jgi:hypothetical protein